MKDYTRKK